MEDENDDLDAEFYEAEAVSLIEAKEFGAAQVFASLAIAASIREAADLIAAIIDNPDAEEEESENDEIIE